MDNGQGTGLTHQELVERRDGATVTAVAKGGKVTDSVDDLALATRSPIIQEWWN